MNEPSYPIRHTAPDGVILRKAIHPPIDAADVSSRAANLHPYVLIADGGEFYLKPTSKDMAFAFDFASYLSTGESVESAAWCIDDASLMIKGSPSIKGARVIQVITGGEVKQRYMPQCTATTSNGRTITLPESGNAYIEITR